METFKFILRFFHLGLFLLPGACFHAPDQVKEINQASPSSLALAPLRFFASDKLMGRATKRPENNIAVKVDKRDKYEKTWKELYLQSSLTAADKENNNIDWINR